MTVAELIPLLQQMPPDALVTIDCAFNGGIGGRASVRDKARDVRLQKWGYGDEIYTEVVIQNQS